MWRGVVGLALICVITVAVAGCAGPNEKPIITVTDQQGVVESRTVTIGYVNERLLHMPPAMLPGGEGDEAKLAFLNEIVRKELLVMAGYRLGISEDENAWAVDQAYAANARYLARLQVEGRQIINQLVTEDRMGVLVIGHPYHHDPGFNHGILEELQVRGYPVLCIESLPTDRAFLEPLFGKEETLRIDDVWMRNFNRNTNLKIWAAKVASRHPNLALIDLSSFKCGHDAPTYSYIESILDRSGTPHFLFHDIDQNKPRASLQIRIKTIDYFLRLEEKKLRAMDRADAYPQPQ